MPLYFDFGCRFGLNFGSILEAKIVIFSMKNRIVFSSDFLWIFADIVGADLHQHCIKNRVRNEKVNFMKMSVSCRRELDFQGPGASTSLQKAPQNRLKKQCIFEVKNASKIEAKMRPQGTTN